MRDMIVWRCELSSWTIALGGGPFLFGNRDAYPSAWKQNESTQGKGMVCNISCGGGVPYDLGQDMKWHACSEESIKFLKGVVFALHGPGDAHGAIIWYDIKDINNLR